MDERVRLKRLEFSNNMKRVAESAHFVLIGGLRNPIPGRGRGRNGIRAGRLIETYLAALEAAYSFLVNRGWKPPLTDQSGKTSVYLCELYDVTRRGCPFTDGANGIPYIVLPCRQNTPSIEEELDYATAAAIHETLHLFNHTYRRLDEADSGADEWEWFDEATAVYMERAIRPDNRQHLRYLLDWIDEPEVPLDDVLGGYERALFVEYLCSRFGSRILTELWTDPRSDEGPVDAITRILTQHDEVSASADPSIGDVFGAGFCVESYSTVNLARDVFDRFGSRAVTESFRMATGRPAEALDESIRHLACRYYRFYPSETSATLRVVVRSDDDSRVLRASLIEVDSSTSRGRIATTTMPTESPFEWTAELPAFSSDSGDHCVLIVSNCGLADPGDLGSGVHYTIQAELI